MAALAYVDANVANAPLADLRLQFNQIGDAGMSEFSRAIASGSLPKLATVLVGVNPGNGMGVKEACSARGIKCYV